MVWKIRYLLVVGSKPMSVSVRVREESSLKHFIEGGLDTRNEVSWAEGSLLDILEVVLVVSVEDQLTEIYGRIVPMGPYLGDVEDVPLVLESISLGHNLHLHCPSG
jgi:hypothetical protein